MACTMATWPFCAARCSGVEPAGMLRVDSMSRSTVRTIIEAPAASSAWTHASLPWTAAKCRAVTPFSARQSMYLRGEEKVSRGFIPRDRTP